VGEKEAFTARSAEEKRKVAEYSRRGREDHQRTNEKKRGKVYRGDGLCGGKGTLPVYHVQENDRTMAKRATGGTRRPSWSLIQGTWEGRD